MLKKRIKTSQSKKGKKFPSRKRIQPDKNKIHVDVVPAKVYPECSVWDDYDFVFNDELEEVDFLNSRVKIPNQKNTHLVLEKEYGPNYKIPLKKSFLGPDKNYYLAKS